MAKPKKRTVLIVAVALAVVAGFAAYTMKYFRYPRVAAKDETAMQIFTDCFEEVNHRFGFSFEPYENSMVLTELYGETMLEGGEMLSLELYSEGLFLSCMVTVEGRSWDTWEEAYHFLQQRDLEQYTQVYDLISYLSDGLYTGSRFKKTLVKKQRELISLFPENHEIAVPTHSTYPFSLFFSNLNSAYVSYDARQDDETGKWTVDFSLGMGLYVK